MFVKSNKKLKSINVEQGLGISQDRNWSSRIFQMTELHPLFSLNLSKYLNSKEGIRNWERGNREQKIPPLALEDAAEE